MAIWNKLKTELDRAGRVAQGALDEGKLRLEVFRARQLVDRAAQSLGYAVYRARTATGAGAVADEAAIARLVEAVRERENELTALEDKMRDLTGRTPPRDDVPGGAGDADAATPPAATSASGFDAATEAPPPPPGFQANEETPRTA